MTTGGYRKEKAMPNPYDCGTPRPGMPVRKRISPYDCGTLHTGDATKLSSVEQFKNNMRLRESSLHKKIKKLEEWQWELEEEIKTLKQRLEDYGMIVAELIADEE